VSSDALLLVEGASVDLPTPRGMLHAVDGVDLTLRAGHTVGIVGESGSGKTMLSRAILQLLPRKARLSGRIRFDGHELTKLDRWALHRLRGRSIAAVFQDPMTSLNPVLTVGRQLIETIQEHVGLQSSAAVTRAMELLEAVGIPEPERRLRQYPHQLSGGMRQRVVIAIALSCEPKLLIADEPTTALDVTVQAQILDLLAREQRRRQMAMMLITHDLGIVAGRTDEVAVMYAGRILERAPTRRLFRHMRVPYTQALLASIPKIDMPAHTTLPVIPGRPPDLARRIRGCAFAERCHRASERCRTERPLLLASEEPDHLAACWVPINGPRGVSA
jgi:peptide/nickel transport system ATP-binding protein